MASATFENILREVELLTPIERMRLSIELNKRTDLPTGADIVASLRTGEPLDPETVDEMERIIEEGCEQVDSNGW